MTDASGRPVPRYRGRFWLFAPFVLLAIIAAAWSAAWFAIRGRTVQALDHWIAREADAGRQWSCPDRTVTGYPFRLEVTCPSLALRRPDLSASVGRVTALAQVYQPRHFIAEVEGPLRASDGRVSLESTWRLLESSVRVSLAGLERASLTAEAPSLRVDGLPLGDIAVAGTRLESHLRPNPARAASEGAYDWVARAVGLKLPALDALVGGGEPTDVEVQLTATRAGGLQGRSVRDDIERWRETGGALEVALLAVAKGPRRVEAKGELRLDELHRPAGRLDGSGVGIEGLIGTLLAPRAGALGALLGALAGEAAPPARGQAGPRPLPPLRLENGRAYLGPVAIPGVRLEPLY